MDHLESNLALLKEKNPELVEKIKNTKSTLVFCKTEQGEDNICEKGPKGTIFLHSQSGAIKENQEWWQGLKLEPDIRVLYVYGIGMGYLYLFAKPWLEENKENYLVFLESDLKVFKCFLATELASEILQNNHVKIVFLPIDKPDKEAVDFFIDLSYYFSGLKEAFTVLPLYRVLYPLLVAFLEHVIPNQATTTFFHVMSHLIQSEVTFKNLCENFMNLEGAKDATCLYGAFKNIPAIICGAGSSIHKNLPLLREQYNKALFFAGGASISLLAGNGLIPHFSAAIDPKAPPKRFFLQTAFETPLLFHPRGSSTNVSLFHGEHLCLPSVLSIPFENWLREQLGMSLTFSFEEYSTVSDALFKLAILFGCNPIILVGLDLSFTESRYYAKGVERDVSKMEEEKTILVKDIFGQDVYTKMDWIKSAELISLWAKENPSFTFINATEGGIGFDGIPNRSLSETSSQLLVHSHDLQNIIHINLEQAFHYSFSKSDVLKHLKAFQISLEKCLVIIKLMGDACRALAIADNEQALQQLETLEKKLESEVAYERLLNFLWELFYKITERKAEEKTQSLDERGKDLYFMVQKINFCKKCGLSHLNILKKLS